MREIRLDERCPCRPDASAGKAESPCFTKICRLVYSTQWDEFPTALSLEFDDDQASKHPWDGVMIPKESIRASAEPHPQDTLTHEDTRHESRLRQRHLLTCTAYISTMLPHSDAMHWLGVQCSIQANCSP